MQSRSLLTEAKERIPGGVNSPVRAFCGVAGDPFFIHSGSGAYITDVDGKQYVDYVGSWGPLILGHAHPYVLESIGKIIKNGLTFGAPTAVEVELARKVMAFMPNIEMLRFVSTGTEAAMSAIRLARGFTQRNKILKFAGCYHGHADSLLAAAGSGGLTFGIPSSAGVTSATTQDTLVAEFNRLDEVEVLFKRFGDDIAAVIVEPIAANMNLVLPVPGFLEGLRSLCDRYQSLLIFDEVITGFRVGLSGATAHFGVLPDLTVLGKIIGGGLPAAAFGGKKSIMEKLAPLGSVYQAGTLSGNPIAMTAGIATLTLLSEPNFYENLNATTQQFTAELTQVANEAGVPLKVNAVCGLFGLLFTDKKRIETESDVKSCHLTLFQQFFHGMLKHGIYFAPSAFECGFISSMHTQKEIDRTLEAAKTVFGDLVRT